MVDWYAYAATHKANIFNNFLDVWFERAKARAEFIIRFGNFIRLWFTTTYVLVLQITEYVVLVYEIPPFRMCRIINRTKAPYGELLKRHDALNYSWIGVEEFALSQWRIL